MGEAVADVVSKAEAGAETEASRAAGAGDDATAEANTERGAVTDVDVASEEASSHA